MFCFVRFLGVSTSIAITLATPVMSMEMEYFPADSYGNQSYPPTIHLEGRVEFDDPERLTLLLNQHPDVERIIVGESPGGSLYGGIGMAELIYDAGLEVQINGPAASAATLISLGARERVFFSPDTKSSYGEMVGTELLFHCAFKRGEQVCDSDATRDSSETLAKFTSWSADEWYRFLMEETTPATVERIKLVELLDLEWDCGEYQWGIWLCSRWNPEMAPQPDANIGAFLASPGQCYVEYQRRGQDPADVDTGLMGLEMMGGGKFIDRSRDVYNTSSGDVAITLGVVAVDDFSSRETEIEDFMSVDLSLSCTDGSDYVSRYSY